jgi:hypothetical protein
MKAKMNLVHIQDWLVFDALKGIFVRLSSTLKLGKAQTDCRECVELKNDLFWAIFRLWQEK